MADTFKKLSTISLGGVNTGTFTSIPNTYTDLQIYFSGRTVKTGSTTDGLLVTINNDTGANYKRTTLYNDYSAIYGNGDNTGYQSYINTGLGDITATNALTNSLGKAWFYFGNYANTSQFKQVSFQGTSQTNSDTANTGYFYFAAAQWANTNAITSIRMFSSSGSSFVTGSSATLYGILKG
jgi:hypothetical protein